MNRIFVVVALAALTGCAHHDSNPYEKPFYAKYLDSSSAADRQIQRDINALRDHPGSAAVHNDLGQLLVQKGFPKDAEREFERAVDADSHFFPAWYNLGLIRASRDEASGARFALRRAVHYKPGHPAALFQLGLIEEKRGDEASAIDYYAKAFSINRALLDVHFNPRILDTKLVALALIRMYDQDHTKASLSFQPAPPGYVDRSLQTAPPATSAPSPQAAAQNIVTPSAPVTSPAAQTQAPAPPPAPRP